MSKIIVGVDASERSLDAVAFARDVARATGGQVLLAAAYPYAPVPARVSAAQIEEYLGQDALERLAIAREALGDSVPVSEHAIADPHPARALHGLAEEAGAALIVVGSSHRSGLRRVMLGSTATRVVHDSPCPVAIVPRGYAEGEHGLARIGCAFDTSPEAEAALAAAVDAATALGAPLQVIRAFDPTSVEQTGAEAERAAREELEAAVAAHHAPAGAQAMLMDGLAGDVLVKASEGLDLLFAGSRGYGPGRGVLLGSVTQRLTGDAACTVIVLPRGAAPGTATLFAPAADTAAG
jgi:nucleotide-binding universal stress UspA family protein